jgi:hypothetical protein
MRLAAPARLIRQKRDDEVHENADHHGEREHGGSFQQESALNR